MVKSKIQITSEQLQKINKFFEELEVAEGQFLAKVEKIEKKMSKEVGIENLFFFQGCDGSYCGVGNHERTMRLIHRR